MSAPPFAIAAETIAICSGVTRSLPWPNDGSMSLRLALGRRVDARGDVHRHLEHRVAEPELLRLLRDRLS